MSGRDPRQDPRAGDSLVVWKQRFTVVQVTQGLVRLSLGRAEISYGILRYRDWALKAMGVTAAAETEADRLRQQRQAAAGAEIEAYIARGSMD